MTITEIHALLTKEIAAGRGDATIGVDVDSFPAPDDCDVVLPATAACTWCEGDGETVKPGFWLVITSE